MGTNNLPEIAPEVQLPAISSLAPKPAEPVHQNISPVENIVKSKLTDTVAIPKETVIVEEKNKLPEKTQPVAGQPLAEKTSADPYREPVI